MGKYTLDLLSPINNHLTHFRFCNNNKSFGNPGNVLTFQEGKYVKTVLGFDGHSLLHAPFFPDNINPVHFVSL